MKGTGDLRPSAEAPVYHIIDLLEVHLRQQEKEDYWAEVTAGFLQSRAARKCLLHRE